MTVETKAQPIRPTPERMAKGGVASQVVIRPTPERFQHDVIDVPQRDRDHQDERPAYVKTQTQIDRYERRKSIDDKQAEAGRRYYEDAYCAGTVWVCRLPTPDRVDGSRTDISDRAVAAGIRRAKALIALGPELVSMAEHVCIHERAAEAWAVARKEHPAAGIAVLRLTLTTLGKHYGIIK